MAAIVNHVHFWTVLDIEARAQGANDLQLAAVKRLHDVIDSRSFCGNAFNELDVKVVDGILAINVRECSEDFQLVVDGNWFTLAIEEDSYLVLTGSLITGVMTGYPGKT